MGVKGDPFYVTMQKGAQAEADAMGAQLIVDGPAQFDPVQQTPIVDAMIARKVDALIIAATDKQAMIEPLQRANDAGIPVISVDTFIGDGDYENGPVTFPLSYIGSDNVQGGMIGCQALMTRQAARASSTFRTSSPGISTTDQREQGCSEAIQAAGSQATLVGVDYNGDSAATSAQQTSALLQRTPDLTGIFGANLFSAEGAAQAVEERQSVRNRQDRQLRRPRAGHRRPAAGAVDLVIAQKPADMGTTGVDYAMQAISGDTSQIQKRVPYRLRRDHSRQRGFTTKPQAAIYKGD